MNETAPKPERYKAFVLILTLLNTIFAATLSGLQVDANIRAGNANRDSQYYAMLASNELVRDGQQGAYDMKLLTNIIKDAQQSLVMQFTALELEQDGNDKHSAELQIQSQIAQARSDKAITFSRLYSDPRYAPTESGGAPNLETYVADQYKAANDLVVQQNAAADDYQKWNGKSDAFVAVLTILAIAFFLLGLAQSSERIRFFFAMSALAILVGAVFWTVLIVLA